MHCSFVPCWPSLAPGKVFWFGGQFHTLTYLECSLQIKGKEEVASKSKDLVGHMLLDATRILGPTSCPSVRTQVSCDLAETLRTQPVEEGVLSQVSRGQSPTGQGKCSLGFWAELFTLPKLLPFLISFKPSRVHDRGRAGDTMPIFTDK